MDKNQPPPPAGPPPDRVDQLAKSLQHAGRIGDLEQELEKLDKATLSEAELESWWHTYGIVAFRAGREQEATTRFEEAYRRFPKSALIRFSLGQQYVNNHKVDQGFDLFRTCVFPQIPRAYALAQARYAYLWNRYDEGFVMLWPFFKTYQEIRILDDHFLYVRGLPFFGTWWAYLAAFSILSGKPQAVEGITAYVSESCCDYDFDYLKTELVAYRDNQPQVLLPLVEKQLEGARSDFPNGYALILRAIIKGRTAVSLQEAGDLLDAVELKDNDFPWLDDVRILAKAEIAHRFSEPDLEQEHVGKFLERQPKLFEPDTALNFHLLRYQELLKPRYQGR